MLITLRGQRIRNQLRPFLNEQQFTYMLKIATVPKLKLFISFVYSRRTTEHKSESQSSAEINEH